jgi:competence protein ComEC
VVTGRHVFLPQKLKVDWIIVGNNSIDVGALSGVSCRGIVLDSSNTFFFASRFLKEAKLFKLEVHSVLHEGAFITNL